jgi:glutamate synthase domain-containing protein 3
MAVKVDEVIAHARHSLPGVDLISPPPMHDIYSIEDLKQLIYELKQLYPEKPVCVKLVSGTHIGTIAAGVVKAGADIIQVSGGSGGTGAATLVSMKHAGLPWELGLAEVHNTLTAMGLRSQVQLRVDGGLSTGRDLVMGAARGADAVGFGKLLLVAEGCIMARVCEKNTCPRGIATHDPKFLKKYVGSSESVVRLLRLLARDVREHLARLGLRSLEELRGRLELLQTEPVHSMLVHDRGIDLAPWFSNAKDPQQESEGVYERLVTALNKRILEDFGAGIAEGEVLSYDIRSRDRAVLARLCGHLAGLRHEAWLAHVKDHGEGASDVPFAYDAPSGRLVFRGSAGQGFAVFLVEGLDVRLEGEANDSVCKSMSGGRVVVVPSDDSTIEAETSTIIGNCALYGATGGSLYVRGCAGDRFAVRNSGAVAVVESVGMHACCYMTKGTVVILGEAGANAGSGMTGGRLYCRRALREQVNTEYLDAQAWTPESLSVLEGLLQEHWELTGSLTAREYLDNREHIERDFVLYLPLSV